MSVVISSPQLRAQVSADGAELIRLQDEQGRDWLWDGDPAFWAGRSPLLFPIVGRVRNDRIRADGMEYELPKHGFARTSRFDIEEASPSHCRLRLCSSEATLQRYPFPFQLDVSYAVEGATLSITASVANTGSSDMPVSFGFHPAFRWPLPYDSPRDAHEIQFEQEETAPIRRSLEGLIKREAEPSPVQGRTLALRDNLFEADALVFDQLGSRSVEYGARDSASLRVDFHDMPHLGIWTKPGAGFVCIEPWQGYADPQDFVGDFSDKPGTVSIQSGETRRFAITITVKPPVRQPA
ncbi:aldose 1-epimerase family protein [Microvirga sp. CF3062]|uniref:aldose 1-epimerase family protein n=1 Tax=Microvirga sp. CF3062 TaxID=3110182 RepID=UPI002E783333|nr:aldose 1-epimerase family protein [Microvirga sp. CF3062]MEE1655343.1 aldose 1-epimerase family protein [Microvirga sp. CF3062]